MSEIPEWAAWVGQDTGAPPPRGIRRRGAAQGPRKLTPRARAVIVRALMAGLPRATAARLAGIEPPTLARWLREADIPGNDAQADLRAAVEAAEGTLEAKLTGVINRAAFSGDWRAAESMLKRRFPDNWGDRQRLDLSMLRDEAEDFAKQFPELSLDEIMQEIDTVLRERGS